jgi:SAM-dependent methyltransferase
MQIDEYKTMFLLEDSYWWYRGLHKILSDQLDRRVIKSRHLSILDAGCGTGKILELAGAYGSVCGIDNSCEALRFVKLRDDKSRLLQGDVSQLPFKNDVFDVLISFDVLCTLDNDIKALKEFHRGLKSSGLLMLNLPSYNLLFSRHDAAVFTKRRYCKKEVIKLLTDNGFKIERATYWNTFLFPVEVFIRIFNKFLPKSNCKSDLHCLPWLINYLLTQVISLEVLLIKRFNFPFGLSLLIVAKKDGLGKR